MSKTVKSFSSLFIAVIFLSLFGFAGSASAINDTTETFNGGFDIPWNIYSGGTGTVTSTTYDLYAGGSGQIAGV